MEAINFFPDYKVLLRDTRLERRGQELWRKLSLTPVSSIRRLSETRAEQKAYYRFLNNEKVEENKLIDE
ncbi:MAG: transposase DNA-binding-containing protein, partial [Bacteroidota bacterium]